MERGASRWAGAAICLHGALIEAATQGGRHPAYRDHYQRTPSHRGRQRGNRVARVEVARKLAEAIWHTLTKGESRARSPDEVASKLAVTPHAGLAA